MFTPARRKSTCDWAKTYIDGERPGMDASRQGGRRPNVGKRLARKNRRRRAPRRPTAADVVNTVPATAMVRAIVGRGPAGAAEGLLAGRRRGAAAAILSRLSAGGAHTAPPPRGAPPPAAPGA